jgi:hypothetical protein
MSFGCSMLICKRIASIGGVFKPSYLTSRFAKSPFGCVALEPGILEHCRYLCGASCRVRRQGRQLLPCRHELNGDSLTFCKRTLKRLKALRQTLF